MSRMFSGPAQKSAMGESWDWGTEDGPDNQERGRERKKKGLGQCKEKAGWRMLAVQTVRGGCAEERSPRPVICCRRIGEKGSYANCEAQLIPLASPARQHRRAMILLQRYISKTTTQNTLCHCTLVTALQQGKGDWNYSLCHPPLPQGNYT